MIPAEEIVSYITSRIGQDISFLAHHGHLSREDEAAIRMHIGKVSMAPLAGQQAQVRQGYPMPPMAMPTPQGGPPPQTPNGNGFPKHIPPNAQPQAGPSTPLGPPVGAPSGKKPDFCKSQWPYNADGSEQNDLSFRKGDIIEIVEETNTDWWTGITRGRTGLFPSNHTVKIPYDPHLFPTPPESVTTPPSTQRPPPMSIEKSLFPPHIVQEPLPSPSPMSMAGPSQMPLAAGPQTPGAKSKLNKTGSKIGNAMAQGFGFGAGAAIAGDIVNAII